MTRLVGRGSSEAPLGMYKVSLGSRSETHTLIQKAVFLPDPDRPTGSFDFLPPVLPLTPNSSVHSLCTGMHLLNLGVGAGSAGA